MPRAAAPVRYCGTGLPGSDHPGRRAIAGNLANSKRAEHEAKTLARGERDKIEGH
jgi:hypothetical protein